MQQLELPGCDRPLRPALPHFGAKWRLAQWIASQFPPHQIYHEPYCGGANVAISKWPAPREIISDLNPALINYLRVVQSSPSDLHLALEKTIPKSRDEFYDCFEAHNDPLEWARRYACIGHGGHQGAGGRWSGGVTRQGLIRLAQKDWEFLYSVSKRLRGTIIQQGNALTSLLAYDSPRTLHYVDPPYPAQARRSRDSRKIYSITPRRQYAYDMYDEESHVVLAAVLHSLRGYVVLSGRICPLYDTLFDRWRRVDAETRDSDRTAQTESLWLNF